MSNYKDIYLHVDCETADIRSHTGKLWSIGGVATYQDHAIAHTELIDPFFYVECLPEPDQWQPSTLKWAMETYGRDFIERCVTEGKKDFRQIWTKLTDAFNEWVDYYVRAGYTVHLVCNHTDFDVTFLKVAYDKVTRPFPIKFNCVWDMPSLLVATTKRSQNESLQALGFTKDLVKHTALEDAKRQAEILRLVDAYLPVYKET